MRKFAPVLMVLAMIFIATGCGTDDAAPLDNTTSVVTCEQVHNDVKGATPRSFEVRDSIRTQCEAGCAPDIGCVYVPSAESEVDIQSAALEVEVIDESTLNVDAAGNCAPAGMFWVGNATLGGVVYEDRWYCSLKPKVDGTYTLQAITARCPESTEPKLVGTSYPDYGKCVVVDECLSDADCDAPAGQCRKAMCQAGVCRDVIDDNATCNDGDLCTEHDACNADGDCHGTAIDCTDENVCTLDSCDPATGACLNEAHVGAPCGVEGDLCDMSSCDDNATCVVSETNCDDGDDCSADSCDPVTGACSHVAEPDQTPCSDGDACTTGDSCVAGVCESLPVNCDDGDPCTTDSCVNGACQHTAVVDGTVCGVEKVCVVGACVDKLDVCPVDDQYSCVDKPIVNPETQQSDKDVSFKHCVFDEGATLGLWELIQFCGYKSSPFTACFGITAQDGCYIPTGTCQSDVDCQDDNLCNGVEFCEAGICQSGETVVCMADEICNPETGLCALPPECSVDQDCDDSDANTTDTCTAGACVYTPVGQQSCESNADCPSGYYCADGQALCYVFSDQHGKTPAGVSGVNGGPNPDNTPDNYDDDGDGYCEVAPCVGSRDPARTVASLQGGDCDDNPDDDLGSRITKGTGENQFLTDGSYENHPGAPEYAGYDNACNGI